MKIVTIIICINISWQWDPSEDSDNSNNQYRALKDDALQKQKWSLVYSMVLEEMSPPIAFYSIAKIH